MVPICLADRDHPVTGRFLNPHAMSLPTGVSDSICYLSEKD